MIPIASAIKKAPITRLLKRMVLICG
jgi:hypothetical protein